MIMSPNKAIVSRYAHTDAPPAATHRTWQALGI